MYYKIINQTEILLKVALNTITLILINNAACLCSSLELNATLLGKTYYQLQLFLAFCCLQYCILQNLHIFMHITIKQYQSGVSDEFLIHVH